MHTSELIIQAPPTSRDTVIVGALAGITAGVAMALWAMLTSVWHGVGLLASFEMIGATFMGPHATPAGLGTAAYGLVLHVATSMGLGILFTALVPQNATRGYAIAAGLGFGLAVLLAMTFVVTPVVNPFLRHAVDALPKSWVIQHALFGATLGLVPLYWRAYRDEAITVRFTPVANRASLIVRRRQAVAPHTVPKLPAPARRPL